MKLDFQIPVYCFANRILLEHQIKEVWDIGCGKGTKLAYLISPYVNKIIGTDSSANDIEICKELMPEGEFDCLDIEDSMHISCRPNTLIICADVLEHLNEPENFLSTIEKEILCIFSTPDSSTMKKVFIQNGKPTVVTKNDTHKHSWTKAEFICLLKNQGFTIIETIYYQECIPYKGIAVLCRKDKS